MTSTWYPSAFRRSYGTRNSESSKPWPRTHAIFILDLLSHDTGATVLTPPRFRNRHNDGETIKNGVPIPVLERQEEGVPEIATGGRPAPCSTSDPRGTRASP